MYRPRLPLLAVALTAALVPVGVSGAHTLARPTPSSMVVAENAVPFAPLAPAALAAESNAASVLASRAYVRHQAVLARTALARAALARAALARQQAAQQAGRRAALTRARLERLRLERLRLERLRVEQMHRRQVLLARTGTLAAARRASRSRALAPAPSGNPRGIALQLLAARGQADQFGCLDNLWSKESGWSVYAANPSGAYGIPQSLPGSKMASAGDDWRTSAATQIRWGLSYIAASYGSPCGAWSHSQSYNWY